MTTQRLRAPHLDHRERHLAALARAYYPSYQWPEVQAKQTYAQLRSVVRAVLPGTQNAANSDDAMDKAVRAVCRVIRRRLRAA